MTPARRAARRCWTAAWALAALFQSGCARAGAATQAPPAAAHADTLFADEFAGRTLDRTRWMVYTGRVYNAELQAYVDDSLHARIAHGAEAGGAADGALVLQARARDPSDAHRPAFTSARLHGRVPFRYGTASARMKLPAGAGLWPAFWLLGTGAWPASGEIDVMENVGDANWVSVALHGPGYSGNTPLLQRATLAPPLDVTAWHVYAVTWTADAITFRIDGRPVYRVTRAEVARHGPPAALDSAKFVVLNLAIGGEYPASVNGVRGPRLGLPEATARRIRAGEARVLVDWVRVVR